MGKDRGRGDRGRSRGAFSRGKRRHSSEQVRGLRFTVHCSTSCHLVDGFCVSSPSSIFLREFLRNCKSDVRGNCHEFKSKLKSRITSCYPLCSSFILVKPNDVKLIHGDVVSLALRPDRANTDKELSSQNSSTRILIGVAAFASLWKQ